MIRIRTLLPIAAAATQFALPALAQQANSLPELLDQVQKVRAEQNAMFEKNRAEYENAPEAQQAALMQKAEKQRADLDASSKKLADTYSANEVQINNLNQQLRDKAMQLGLAEMFGLARQVANDISSTLQQSLISTQFPAADGQLPRDEWLRQFAASRVTPTAAELERVWVEIQREMTASGQVARYRTNVVQPSGENVAADVIRIGPFNAISNGQFLTYLPSLRTLSVLPRQLPPEFMSVAAAFQSATSGYVSGVVDPNRGVVLGLYVERPTIEQRIQRGEEIGYVIITVGVLGVLAFLYQLISLVFVRLAVGKQLKNLDNPMPNNPLGRVLLAFKGNKGNIEEEAEVAELRITEAVFARYPGS